MYCLEYFKEVPYDYYDQFSTPSLQILFDECCEPEIHDIIQEILEERGELLNA